MDAHQLRAAVERAYAALGGWPHTEKDVTVQDPDGRRFKVVGVEIEMDNGSNPRIVIMTDRQVEGGLGDG